MTSWEVVSATGHRKLTKLSQAWVRLELSRIAEKLRNHYGTKTAVSGMALNADQMWAEAALAVPDLRLHAVVPFPGQGDLWSVAEKARWSVILAQADVVSVVSEEDPRDRAEAARMLYRRNDKMLVISDAVVAVWDPRRRQGGTYSAVRVAVARRLPVIWLNPQARTVTMPSADSWQRLLGQRGAAGRSEAEPLLAGNARPGGGVPSGGDGGGTQAGQPESSGGEQGHGETAGMCGHEGHCATGPTGNQTQGERCAG